MVPQVRVNILRCGTYTAMAHTAVGPSVARPANSVPVGDTIANDWDEEVITEGSGWAGRGQRNIGGKEHMTAKYATGSL